MPFGVSWSTYSKYWAAALTGGVCGSQVVHVIYKPLQGFEDLVESEYQVLREQSPPPTLEDRVAHFDSLHKQFEEYEKNKEPLKLPRWLTRS